MTGTATQNHNRIEGVRYPLKNQRVASPFSALTESKHAYWHSMFSVML